MSERGYAQDHCYIVGVEYQSSQMPRNKPKHLFRIALIPFHFFSLYAPPAVLFTPSYSQLLHLQ